MAYCKYSPSDVQAHDAGSSPQSNHRMSQLPSQSRAMVSPFTQSSVFSLALVELISLVVVPVISILSLLVLLIILA